MAGAAGGGGNMCLECFECWPRHVNCRVDPDFGSEVTVATRGRGQRNTTRRSIVDHETDEETDEESGEDQFDLEDEDEDADNDGVDV